MPRRGGPSAITGYDYQFWFIAYQFSKLISNEDLIIHPEANIIQSAEFDSNGQAIRTSPKINFVDDVVVYSNKVTIVYNIKYLAPQDSSWSLNRLKSVGVLKDILKQTKSFPDHKIVFVSQSSCPMFNDVFKRIRSLKSKKEIELTLTKKQLETWKELKNYTKLNDGELLKISKNIDYERGYEIKEYQELILSFSKDKFDRCEQIPLSLYALAIDSCKESRSIAIRDFITWLENNNIRAISKFKIIDLLNESKKVSASLRNWNNIFGRITSSHIKRREVTEILDWTDLVTPQDKKPILLLTGKAGCGKSVILRDVLEELEKKSIVSIGLKLDLYNASSFEELRQNLNLSDDFEKIINTISSHGKIVIVFDQLDSLSHTLSTDRKSINFYFDIINRVSTVPNVKIILSCRKYDLDFDPSLKALESEQKIELGDLTDDEMNSVLTFIGISKSEIPEKLAKLLSNPQNLNIFCTVYDTNLVLHSIRTIQDLYNELWIRKISLKSGIYPNLNNLIKEIVQDMSSHQKLIVSSILYQDKFYSELKYLLSEGLLIEDDFMIQFFHQTFYDYCFARIFVTDKKDFIKHMLDIHQGLFIRATVKQVLNYQRSIESDKYLSTLKDLLISSKIRFHIKSLLLSLLGSEEEPMENEWEIINTRVLNNVKLRIQFIDSIRCIYWFDKLNSSNYLIRYLTSTDEDLKQSSNILLYRLVTVEPLTILRFLLNSKEFKNKQLSVREVLFNLKDWNNQESIQLFESIQNMYDSGISFHLEHIFKSAFRYHKSRMIAYIEKYLNKCVKRFLGKDRITRGELYDYEIEQILEFIYKYDKEIYFNLVLPIIRKLIFGTAMAFESTFIVDSAFYHHSTLESIYSYWRLLDNLIEHSVATAAENESNFRKLFIPLLQEKSLTIIDIVISGLLKRPEKFIGETFELLLLPEFLKDYKNSLSIIYKVHQLIKLSYPLFSETQQSKLNEAMLNVEERKVKKVEERQWKGSSIYYLLNAIPDENRIEFPDLQKKYLELQRKFGERIEKPPIKSRGSFVGPPLPATAYEKMSLKDWLSSFKHYNELTGWDKNYHNKRGFNFGGLVEHSRAFGNVVKKNPDRYYPFLEKITTEKIAADYIAEGINALIETNFAPNKVQSLLYKVFEQDKRGRIKKTIIRGIEYIDGNSSLDRVLLEILIDLCLNDPDPEVETWEIEAFSSTPYYGGDPLTAGLNSVRGSAAFALVKLKNVVKYKEEIFLTLEKLAKDKSTAVRCAAAANMNILIRLDEERVFKIYQMFTNDKNEYLLRSTLNCLSYYSKKKFSLIKENLIYSSKLKGDYGYQSIKNFVGRIIMYLYLDGVRGSKNLYDTLIKNDGELLAGCINYAKNYLTNQNPTRKRKASKVFLESINSKNQSVQNELSHSFKEFNVEDFPSLYKFLRSYSKHRKVKKRERYNFFEYLFKCVDSYPKECILIMDNIIKDLKVTPYEFFDPEKPIKILIGAYNKLKDYNKPISEKAMDIFDQLIQTPGFRHSTDKVLYEADYS